MTDNQPDNTAPGDAASNIEAVPFNVGAALREARVAHGLSVGEVSNRIKFAPRQIEALEADDFAHLPENTFVRGFVRSYARLLQLDEAPLLAALPHAPEQSISLESKALTEVPYPDIYTERRQNIIWLAAALAVAVVLALAAWLLGNKPKAPGVADVTVSDERNAKVETLELPKALPVSSVPDMEPVAAMPNVQQVGAEKAAAEKLAAEKDRANTEKLAAEKAQAEKLAAEKASAEKAAAKMAAEKAVAEKVGVEMANAEKLAAKIAAEKSAAEKKKSAPQVAPPVQAAAVNQAVKPTTATAGRAAIRMTFDTDSWVEIRDKDNKILFSQTNQVGTEQNINVNGNPPYSLVIGNAKAVHLYYKGRAVDLAPHIKVEVARLTLE